MRIRIQIRIKVMRIRKSDCKDSLKNFAYAKKIYYQCFGSGFNWVFGIRLRIQEGLNCSL
jgi:hypothetical protein